MRRESGEPDDVLITLGDDTITLKNVAVASLHASDFIVSPHQLSVTASPNSRWLRDIDAIFWLV